jgi:hypothetical protein
MEAIMDLKTGNAKGAMMELNLTDQGIKMPSSRNKKYDDGTEKYDGSYER